MTEGIVSWSTEDGAAIAVVVLIAQEAVRVTQLRPAGCLHVLGPFLSHGEVTLSGDPADEVLWVVCAGEG